MLEFSDAFGDMLPTMLVKLGVAIACGVLLGIEREVKDKPAGLRTMVLITVGSALYMIVSELLPIVAEGMETTLRVDPGRVAAQVVTGIGFLGAGAIIQARGAVHGLTTAAVIWVAAGIGLCVGAGFPLLGLGATLIVILSLLVLDPLRLWLSRRADLQEIYIRIPNDALILKRTESLLATYDVSTSDVYVNPIEGGNLEVHARLHADNEALARLLEAVSDIPGSHGRAAR